MLVVVENLLWHEERGQSRGKRLAQGFGRQVNPGGLEVGEAGPSALGTCGLEKTGSRGRGNLSSLSRAPPRLGKTADVVGGKQLGLAEAPGRHFVIGQVVFR